MVVKRREPRSVAVENVVFVEFPTPVSRWEYIDRLAAEGRQAVAALRSTIERTRWLAQRARALTTPGGVPAEVLAACGSDPEPDSRASSRVQYTA
jgi:hypothetical protein